MHGLEKQQSLGKMKLRIKRVKGLVKFKCFLLKRNDINSTNQFLLVS